MSYRDVVILVVEDNPGDAHLIRAMLEETEYATAQLHAVGTLHEAKEANVDHRSVVLVLLDLNLPDSDGIETLLGIKDIYGDSAIIVLTGLEDENVASQALREGAQNYLVKGTIDAPALARAMRYALERHGFVMRLRDADRLLAEKELRFRMLIEHATDLNLLVDSAGIVTYTSPSVRRVFGYEHDLTPDVFSLIHRDDLALAYACFEKALHRPEEPLPLMVRARTHDGRVIWLEGTVVDLQHVQGVSGVVVNLRDITERVAIEQRIAFERSNLDALINSTQDNVWSLDRNNCLLTANNGFLDALEGITGRRLVPGG